MKRSRLEKRTKKRARIRAKISGSADRPRISVFKSLKYTSGQVIDDVKGETIVSYSTSDIKEDKVEEVYAGFAKMNQAYLVGSKLAELCIEKGVKQVVFDRGGYPYHGRVKALAEGMRSKGIEF